MPVGGLAPDLDVRLRLDAYAPRAARHHVAGVDRPSPDLRDAVVLLTSELVTRVLLHGGSEDAHISLRVWMPAELARVELHAPAGLIEAPVGGQELDYSQVLLEQIADRWSVEQAGGEQCMWFEIDRHGGPAPSDPSELHTQPELPLRAYVRLGSS